MTGSDPESVPLTYSITGGADQAGFSIGASTGVLAFVATPDYEAHADADHDNVYQVQVAVSDGVTTPASQTIAVTVTNADEVPFFTSSATPTVAENSTAVLTVVASDPESAALTYAITRGRSPAPQPPLPGPAPGRQPG